MSGGPLNRGTPLVDFALREWMFFTALVGAAVTSVFAGRWPVPSIPEVEVLFILWVLFVTVRGLERSGAVGRIGACFSSGRFLPVTIVVVTFVLAAIVTNDVAVVVVVPLILTLGVERKGMLVVLAALAANAGSILTPFGNPQNLFIYWFYDLSAAEFVGAIAPLGIALLAALAVIALALRRPRVAATAAPIPTDVRSAYVYAGLLVLVILAVLHTLPLAVGLLVIAYALAFDRDALGVDYTLLGTFLFFFIMTENLQGIIGGALDHAGHVFLVSALASQVMSNVPTAILFSKFTPHWDALAWGVNVGGFGSLVASFANLIAYRFYVNDPSTGDTRRFTTQFLALGYGMFVLGVGLYWVTGNWR